ncbi:MAG: DNA mismatch repair endonuclease MutL [Bacteroides sp.]|nr:DNA mismatch repair endonuclease MutL [Bacteroides sp.]
MSDMIRLLPASVANQIAAGEVIQRPASVVKELVENAIDAGAKNIQVLVTDAGKTSVQVIDDGIGMSETDARLAFERHATSKISKANDLFSLKTMGFRGEALASIAAVAQVELKTRRQDMEIGTKVEFAASELVSQEAASCSPGCTFYVRNLFYNIPTRRKFLKSNTTELSNILVEFERIALVNPHLSFLLYHNDTELFNLPVASHRQRIINIFGKKLNQQLLNLEVETTLVKVSGYVAKPEASRKKGAHQYFFVNGRYMRHPYFHKAVMEAYDRLIPVGEQISYFIYLEVDPASIDINIHPTKTEIKFENEQAIWQVIAAVVKETLGKFNAVPSIDFDTEDRPDIPVFSDFSDTPAVSPPVVAVNYDFNPFRQTTSTPAYSRPDFNWESLYSGTSRESKMNKVSYYETERDEEFPNRVKDDFLPLYGQEKIEEKGSQHLQIKGRYILTSVKSGLMLIDQHRAHVLVLYNKYMEQLEQRQGVSQGVLFPEVIQLPSSEATVLEHIMDELTAIGFELSNLGGSSYAINGTPSGMEGVDPVELIRQLLYAAIEKGKDLKEEINHILALTLAKATAIVYGQYLSHDEMVNLVDSLFACPTPNYTPDGKTILSVLKEEEIDKRFK